MTEVDFYENGFTRIKDDPQFVFKKQLITNEEIERLLLEEYEVPCLLYGETTENKGFCLWTGNDGVWIKATTVKQAIEFCNNIVAFEEP